MYYTSMRKDKEVAFHLRLNGKSYNEIHAALKIPVSTLSDWFSRIGWSKDIAKKLATAVQVEHTARIVELDRIRGEHLKRVYEEAREGAKEDLKILKYNPLFIAGLMLYWGEGDKLTPHSVKLSNTDPGLIRLYVFFLKNVCRIPEQKIKAQLLIYPDLNDKECKEYWARESGLDPGQFTKSSTIQGKHKTRRIKYGVCMIVVSSKYFKVKILEWLKSLPEELMNREYYENM